MGRQCIVFRIAAAGLNGTSANAEAGYVSIAIVFVTVIKVI